MQDESINEKRIRKKKEHLKVLLQQWELASNQLIATLNQSEKPSIQKTIDDLEKEIDELDNKIKKLQLSSFQGDTDKVYSNHSRNWEEKFPKIDFKNTNKILKSTLDKFEDQEGAALFLLQNSRSMGGHWCIKNIKSQLQGIGKWYSPCEFEFLSHQEANPSDFLNYLAQKFAVQPCDQIPTYTERIINNICESLCNGNILFIQIDIYDLNSQDTFLDWFVQQFWCTLLRRLPEISKKHPSIRFVAVLSIRGSIPKDFLLSDLCCKNYNFDSKKFLELPLKKWTNEEIKNWLFKFSGLTAIGVTLQEIERMAENIHRVTKGKPDEVYKELMEAMSKRVS